MLHINSKPYLLLSFISYFLISGCDFDITQEKISPAPPTPESISYQSQELDALWQEILSLGVADDFVKAEYQWIGQRNDHCQFQTQQGSDQCVNDANQSHTEVLTEHLIRKLMVASDTRPIPKEFVVPGELVFPASRPGFNYFPTTAISANFRTVAYISPKGTLYFADLSTGKILNSIPNFHYGSKPLPDIDLSPNGKLLVVNRYGGETELIAAENGRVLKHQKNGDRRSFFTKSGLRLAVWSKDGLVARDPATFELVASSGYRARYQSKAFFDRKTNRYFGWGYPSKTFFVTRFEEGQNLHFDATKEYSIPENIADSVDHISLSAQDDQVYISGMRSLFRYSLTDDQITEIGPSAIHAPEQIFEKQGYTLQLGRLRNDLMKFGLVYTDLLSGNIGFQEISEQHRASIIDLPLSNQVLVASYLGVRKVTLDPDSINFRPFSTYAAKNKKWKPSVDVRASPAQALSFPRSRRQEGVIYKCKNDQGKLEITDTPCKTGEQTIIQTKKKEADSNYTASSTPVMIPQGKEGINFAVREGLIRVANRSDIRRWEIASHQAFKQRRGHVYVILKPIILSGGLTGAHSVTFIVHDRRLMPGGSLGHSFVLFTENGACMGTGCDFAHAAGY